MHPQKGCQHYLRPGGAGQAPSDYETVVVVVVAWTVVVVLVVVVVDSAVVAVVDVVDPATVVVVLVGPGFPIGYTSVWSTFRNRAAASSTRW